MKKPDRGKIEIAPDLCKGCQLCIAACPVTAIRFSEQLNKLGYRPAVYSGHGCTGCGACFYVCPEPGAIRVYLRQAGHMEDVLSANSVSSRNPL